MTDFVLVPASTLSLTDDFMCHVPKTDQEKVFNKILTKVISSGVSDFYRPKLDPSLDSQGKICYQPGLRPAVGKSYNWWEKNAKEFCPERKSRLGTKSEYVAFLGVLIKKLVEHGWEVAVAWNAVCNDSKSLGHYWNSEGALRALAPTGSREIYGFSDLANVYKMVAEDKDAGGLWVAGGGYDYYGYCNPIADLYRFYYRNNESNLSVGWIVLEK